MQIKKKQSINSFKKALLMPFFLCLLALLPQVRTSYEWLELKTLDLLFTFYPEICKITGHQSTSDNSTLIIAKDQSFQEKFGRSPNRRDYGQLLDTLKNQGGKVAAFDFIFDEATAEAIDKYFASELASFPYPILAHNFTSRGQQNFSLVNIKDEKANRPTWPKPLFKAFSDSALGKGLINIPADLDSVIRYAPLAYHPDESEEFLPTLGFAAYINTLLVEKDGDILNANISSAPNIKEALKRVYQVAPYEVTSLGHLGLDRAVSVLETQHISRLLKSKYPSLTIDKNDLDEFAIKLSKENTKTWIKLPKEPLPIIGSYHTPCIRLPYEKQGPPFNDDSITTISMSRLMETQEEETSIHMFGKNYLDLSHPQIAHELILSTPVESEGNMNISGEIKTVKGKAIANATLWAINTQSGYWAETISNSNGKYAFSNLQEGYYILSVYIKRQNGWDKAIGSFNIDETNKELPLLLLDENTNSLSIPASLTTTLQDSHLWVRGEIIPMLRSNNEGNIGITQIPEGFSLLLLDESDGEEEQILSLSSSGQLLVSSALSPNTNVALMPNEDSWKISFYRKVSLEANKENIIGDLPASLDSVVSHSNSIASETLEQTQELAVIPGQNIELERLPQSFNNLSQKLRLKVRFRQNTDSQSQIILLSESGEILRIDNKSETMIDSGKYLVLTQSGKNRGLYKPSLIDGKTLFIGTSTATDQDFIVTPMNFLDRSFSRVPGVNVHANLFSALRNQKFFYVPEFHSDRSPLGWPFYQLLLVMPIFWLLNLKFGKAESTKSSYIVLLLIGLLVGSAAYLFPRRILIPVFYPSLLIISFSVTRGFVEWSNSRRLARETQNAFGRFISSDIVKEIVNNPDTIKPGGEKKELTVIFTDIAGFTSISEKLEAEELTELMNNYLEEMTNILFKHGGTLDKYIGDAIMGFWNHPTPQEDHCTRAVSCAIDMQKKLRELREEWIAKGLPKVEVRAGINSGNCMVGFIGSKTQMNFTCLGDNVNLASRLEGANKAYGTYIMITESVKQKLNPYLFSMRFLDFLAVKGKEQPVLVYEVRGFISDEVDSWKEQASSLYEQGIKLYLNRDWDSAIRKFRNVLELMKEDEPSKVYIERCVHFKENPPAPGWDGRFILKTK